MHSFTVFIKSKGEISSYLRRCAWWPQVISWSWRAPAHIRSCRGWWSPLQRARARPPAPGRWSWPAGRWGWTPGSCRGTPPCVRTRGSRRSWSGQWLPGRGGGGGGTRWSHTQAGCTDCSASASEPGVSPTGSWGTCRYPRRGSRQGWRIRAAGAWCGLVFFLPFGFRLKLVTAGLPAH